MPTRTRACLLAWSICNNLLARQHHSTEMQEESRRYVVVEDNACDDAQEAHETHESERALHIPISPHDGNFSVSGSRSLSIAPTHTFSLSLSHSLSHSLALSLSLFSPFFFLLLPFFSLLLIQSVQSEMNFPTTASSRLNLSHCVCKSDGACSIRLVWSWCGKLAASAWEKLKQANTKFWYFEFSVRICYVFVILKCTREPDLSLCWLCDLPRECHCAVATSDSKTCLATKFVGSRHCAAAFFLQVMHRPRSESLVRFNVKNM